MPGQSQTRHWPPLDMSRLPIRQKPRSHTLSKFSKFARLWIWYLKRVCHPPQLELKLGRGWHPKMNEGQKIEVPRWKALSRPHGRWPLVIWRGRLSVRQNCPAPSHWNLIIQTCTWQGNTCQIHISFLLHWYQVFWHDCLMEKLNNGGVNHHSVSTCLHVDLSHQQNFAKHVRKECSDGGAVFLCVWRCHIPDTTHSAAARGYKQWGCPVSQQNVHIPDPEGCWTQHQCCIPPITAHDSISHPTQWACRHLCIAHVSCRTPESRAVCVTLVDWTTGIDSLRKTYICTCNNGKTQHKN